MNKRKAVLISLLVLMLLGISGCEKSCTLLGNMIGDACAFMPDSAHCYQQSAIQSGDADICDSIEVPEQFKSAGSNPPKDKCYMTVAENTGDYEICKRMKGGLYSYEKEECLTDIAISKVDPAGCRMMTGAAFEACKSKVGEQITVDTMKDLDQQADDLKNQLKSDPDDKELKEKLNDMEKRRKDMTDFMPPGVKSVYIKEQREAIMEDVDDEDVKDAIYDQYKQELKNNPTMTVDQMMDRLKEIKQQQEFVKRADDLANEMVDSLKEKANEYIDEQQEEMTDKIKEEGWNYIKEKSGDDLKYYLNRLEDMKDKYDKASEKWDEINKKIEKVKKAYDEVMGVYKKVDDVNRLMAEGKIEKGHAQVIKGAIFLGKGLEYATEYVPVFGSTISKVSKETFEMTVNVAKKRAQRTTSLNKCIEDPEHCDPNGISAY